MTPKDFLYGLTRSALELGLIRECETQIVPTSIRHGLGVHLNSGLSLLAEAAESEVETTCSPTDLYPFESSFTRNGVRFFQIGKTPEESRE